MEEPETPEKPGPRVGAGAVRVVVTAVPLGREALAG